MWIGRRKQVDFALNAFDLHRRDDTWIPRTWLTHLTCTSKNNRTVRLKFCCTGGCYGGHYGSQNNEIFILWQLSSTCMEKCFIVCDDQHGHRKNGDYLNHGLELNITHTITASLVIDVFACDHRAPSKSFDLYPWS